MRKRGRGPFIFFLSILAVGVLSLLSRVPIHVLTVAGSWLGGLYYHLDRSRKGIALSNLRLALGKDRSERELRDLLKSVYRNMGSSLMEFAALPRLTRKRMESLVRFQGLENIASAQKEGKGIILLNAHLGNWELYAQGLALLGYPVYVIGRRANVNLLQDYIVRCRESRGNKVILRTHGMRKILRVLKQGNILGIMGDQRGSTSRGLMVDFFGRPAPTSPSLARIILKTGATVLISFGVRNPDQTHTVYISKPMKIPPPQDPQRDLVTLTRQYMKTFEEVIRQHPDQWLWMHRRWMRRNSGN